MRCNSDQCKVEHRSSVVDFKGLTLEVDGLAETVCQSCQYVWETQGQQLDNLSLLREAFVKRRDEVRIEEGLLTGDQVERALTQLDISRAEAAQVFGGGPNAFNKYITGEVLQSKAMDRLIRLTLAFGYPALRYLREGANAPFGLYAGVLMIERSRKEASVRSSGDIRLKPHSVEAVSVFSTSSTAVMQ